MTLYGRAPLAILALLFPTLQLQSCRRSSIAALRLLACIRLLEGPQGQSIILNMDMMTYKALGWMSLQSDLPFLPAVQPQAVSDALSQIIVFSSRSLQWDVFSPLQWHPFGSKIYYAANLILDIQDSYLERELLVNKDSRFRTTMGCLLPIGIITRPNASALNLSTP